MLQTIYEILLAPLILALSLTSAGSPQRLGAALPSATAVFETSLASPITSSATSMTLSANAVRGGGSISGYNCFTIDEGSAQAETTCGTVSGTSVTSLSRGISQATGTTTVAALQFSHRRGANVKITDFPLVQILKAQNNGEDTFENTLKYASGVTTAILGTNNQNLASVAYANSLSFGAIPAASESASGFVELSTQLEAASSTSSGSAARLVLPASIATSTYNSATAALRVPMTGYDGKIDSNFVSTTSLYSNANLTGITTAATTSFSGNVTLTGNATSTIASSSVIVYTSSTTPTTTWTKQANLKYIRVRVVGAGGDSSAYAGGGGGAYGEEIIPASALGATELIAVGGSSGAGTGIGGTSYFGSHCIATGGNPGSGSTGGGDAGTIGCTISVPSYRGQNGDASEGIVGNGGTTPMARIGAGGYGGDGGYTGIVIVEEFYY